MTDKIPSRKVLVLMPRGNWSALDIAQTRMTPHFRAPHIVLQTGKFIVSPVADAVVFVEYVGRTLHTQTVIGESELVQLEKHTINAILICNNFKARVLYGLLQKIKRKA